MKELNGAWEERGVIGTRVEIDGNKIVVLWRSSPVLTTAFRVKRSDCAAELILKKTGLRYAGAAMDYAEITGMAFADGKLTLTEHFPITGESKTVLTPTENTRYGRCAPDPSALPLVAGEWTDEKGYCRLFFREDRVTINGRERRFVVLRPFDGGELFVADADPAADGWEGMDRLVLRGEVLLSSVRVCDAPSVPLIFHRVK